MALLQAAVNLLAAHVERDELVVSHHGCKPAGGARLGVRSVAGAAACSGGAIAARRAETPRRAWRADSTARSHLRTLERSWGARGGTCCRALASQTLGACSQFFKTLLGCRIGVGAQKSA